MAARDPQFDGTGLSPAHIGDAAHADLVGNKVSDDELIWVPVSAYDLEEISGTWTPGEASDVAILTRTAAASTDVARAAVKVPGTREQVGLTPAKVVAVYSVNTADSNDVTFELIETLLEGDNSAPTADVLAGDQDAHYDAAHNTAAERGSDAGAPEEHTLEVTVPAANRAQLDQDSLLSLRMTVDGAASSVVIFKGARVGVAQARYTDD